MREELIDYPVSEAWANHYRNRGYIVPEDLIRRREPLPTPQAHADDIARSLELYRLREEVAMMRAEKQELERYVEITESRVAQIEKTVQTMEAARIAALRDKKAQPITPTSSTEPTPIRPRGGVSI